MAEKVEVYIMSIKSVVNKVLDDLLPLFSIARQKRIKQYYFCAERNRTMLAELLARYLLAKKTGSLATNIIFEYNYYGKPYWPEANYSFNLSHSGNWLACSIGQEENGVDIESLEEISMQIVKMYFSSIEYEWIIAQPETSRSLEILKLWTIKESYLKYHGVGINQSLDLIDALALSACKENIGVKNFILKDKTILAVCTKNQLMPTKINEIALEQIVSGGEFNEIFFTDSADIY